MGGHQAVKKETPDDEPLVKIDVVARYTGGSTRSVYRYVQKGLIPHIRIGHTLRFRMSAVKRWLEGEAAGKKEGST